MNNKSRTLINIIGLPIIVSSILVGGFLFNLFIALIIILGTKEYIDLLKKHSIVPLTTLLYTFQIILILSSFSFIFKVNLDWNQGLSLSSHFNFVATCFLVFIFTFFSMIIEVFKKTSSPLLNISSSIFGFIWIGIFLNSLVYLRYEAGHILTLVIFLSLWSCDTFAFYFGKKFGKTKIMPTVSPNKTVLGSVCGLCGSILILLISFHFKIIELSLFDSLILGLITGGVSQFGDFFESKLKREVNIKDTSNILRGHGGILDRFDSLMIISPIILMFLYFVK